MGQTTQRAEQELGELHKELERLSQLVFSFQESIAKASACCLTAQAGVTKPKGSCVGRLSVLCQALLHHACPAPDRRAACVPPPRAAFVLHSTQVLQFGGGLMFQPPRQPN